jgi:hypothetical protein
MLKAEKAVAEKPRRLIFAEVYPEAMQDQIHFKKQSIGVKNNLKGAGQRIQELAANIRDWSASNVDGKNDAKIAEARADQEEIVRQSSRVQSQWFDEIELGIHESMGGNLIKPSAEWSHKTIDFKVIDRAPYANLESIPDLTKAVNEKRADFYLTRDALRTNEEIFAVLELIWNRKKEQGAIGVSALCAGGTVDPRTGEFRLDNAANDFVTPYKTIEATFNLNADNRLDRPTPVTGSIVTQVDSALAMMAFLDDGGMIQKLKHAAAKFTQGKLQLSMADKPAALRTAQIELTEARRKLEFACRRDEANGMNVKRPDDTPWTILVWLEEDKTPKPKLVASAPGVKVAKRRMWNPGDPDPGEELTADDFEGEDETADA